MATEYNACVDLLDRNVEGGRADHPAVVTRARSVTYAELLGEVQATRGRAPAHRRRARAAGRHGDARLRRVLRRLPRGDAHRRRRGPGEPAAARPRPGRHRRQQPRPRPGGVGRAGRRGRRDPRRGSRGRDRDRDRLARVGLAHQRDRRDRSDGPATRRRPGTSRRASGCAPPGRRAGPSWPCTATSTCGSRPTPTPREVLGIGADDRCYSVGPMFHAYGLGNSLTFPVRGRCHGDRRADPAADPGARRRDRAPRCARRCCSASRPSTPRWPLPTWRPTRSRPCAGGSRPPSRCRPRPSTGSTSASACRSSTASAPPR